MKYLFLIVAATVVACSKSEPPPAPPPAPPACVPGPTTQCPVTGGLGGSLTDPSPGTPLYQISTHDHWQAMQRNLGAYGTATLQAATTLDYVVQGQAGQVRWMASGQPQPQQNPHGSYQISPVFGSGSLALQFASYEEGSGYYQFQYQVSLQGLVLYSTDQVALFVSQSYEGQTILKIAYRNPNPQIQAFVVQASPYGGPHYRVVQRAFATQFIYPQQGQ